MPRIKNVESERENLRSALIREFGDGAVVSRNDIEDFRTKHKFLSSATFITNNTRFKVFRGYYLITESNNYKQIQAKIQRAKARLRKSTTTIANQTRPQ